MRETFSFSFLEKMNFPYKNKIISFLRIIFLRINVIKCS